MAFRFYYYQSDNSSDAIGYKIGGICRTVTENIPLVKFDQTPIHTTDPEGMKQGAFANSGGWTHLHKSNNE